MSNYPTAIDDDSTLPAVNDNLDDIGGEAINALRDATVQIETALGTNIAGTMPSLAARLGVFINSDGTPNTSVLYNLGLVVLPVTNIQIAENAGIPESKLLLDYRTQDLFNYIRDIAKDVNLSIGWISTSGVKLEPHLIGAIYRHDMTQIDVNENPIYFLNNVFRALRNNTDSYSLANDMNNELLSHQWADGSQFGNIQNIYTNDGSSYPSSHAHLGSGIYLISGAFNNIPQTIQDVQALAEYIDSSTLFSFGNIVQNLYAAGISRKSQASQLGLDGYGQAVVPPTPCTAYLSTSGPPVDNIETGDDIIQFNPPSALTSTNVFDSWFASVQPGDIIRVNYGTIEVPFVIREKKYNQSGINKTYAVRIAGKNLFNTSAAIARIDKDTVNTNKYGVLATAAVQGIPGTSPPGFPPSLIVGSPRGAQALGIGFDPAQFDSAHYLLYLALYPDGNPADGYIALPGIDVTGNFGTTPGSYTLDSIVQATNAAFRAPGYNYRFIAFSYQGEFGIMLADSYNGASFSIISGLVLPSGVYDPVNTPISYMNNVVGVFPPSLTGTFSLVNNSPTVTTTANLTDAVVAGSTIVFNIQSGQSYTVLSVTSSTITLTSNYSGTTGTSTAILPSATTAPDPLGFGASASNLASPPYVASYPTAAAALSPTIVFVPLQENNVYVNGSEISQLTFNDGYERDQTIDKYGDGYWIGTISSINPIPGIRTEVIYSVPFDLSETSLAPGKTVVVQSLGSGTSFIDVGRFTVNNISYVCSSSPVTYITVYDAVHATGVSPYPSAPVGTQVAIYFSPDSVSFNSEQLSDFSSVGPFKRHFEAYLDQNQQTYTQERGRFYIGGSSSITIDNSSYTLHTNPNLLNMNLVKISPKLKGYQFGAVNAITLLFTNYISTSDSSTSGYYTAQLAKYNGSNYTNLGPLTTGKRGQVTRFYDETNIDYIDIMFDLNNVTIGTVSAVTPVDIQLFPTLSLDQDLMFLSTYQLNDTTFVLDHYLDQRQFGNISEEELSTSALSYISTPERLLHTNGIIRGFDLETGTATVPNPNPNAAQLYLTGGTALVNGKFVQIDAETVTIPLVQELYPVPGGANQNINWLLCANDKAEYQLIVLADYDSTLNTPNNPTRVVSLVNVLTGGVYQADSVTFSDVINLRKDLCPIYIVGSTVVSQSISTTINDARKYINDGDSNFPLRLTSSQAQGNFRSPISVFNWLKYNSNFNGSAFIKGANATIGSNISLESCVIDGEGDATLVMSGQVTLGSNLTLQNLTITFNGGINIALNSQNINFINCNIFINAPTSGTMFANNITFNFSQCNNVNFQDTDLTVTNVGTMTNSLGASVTASGGALFYLTSTTNFVFNNSNVLNVTYVSSQGVTVPGDVFIVRSSPGIEITNSSFNGNFAQFFRNTLSNNFLLQNLTVESSYTPFLGNIAVNPDVYNSTTDPLGAIDNLPTVIYNPYLPSSWTGPYTSGNIVNSGRGYIYANVSTSLDSGTIDNITFSCNMPDGYSGSTPLTTAAANYHRFSYINFEISLPNAILSNIRVTNCKFQSLNTGGTSTPTSVNVEDFRPAIAIVNTSPAVSTSTTQQPLLQNVFIQNNFCNRSQSIVLTSKTNSSGQMVYPGLAAANVAVVDNTCGTIGYWISAGAKVINTPPNTNAFSDKTSGLVISDNVCHYIATMDATGTYFLVSRIIAGVSTNMSAYPSGYVTIRDNSCNWIHTGISFEENSTLNIIDNALCAYDQNYITTNFADGTLNWQSSGFPNAIYNPIILIGDSLLGTSLPGTFTVSNGSATVTTSTTFSGSSTPPLIAGDTLIFSNYPGVSYLIQNITGTTITLSTNFAGAGTLVAVSAITTSIPVASIDSSGYAIFVGSNRKQVPDAFAPGEGNDSSVQIRGNTIETGYWLETTTFNFTYQYPFGYVMTQSSCDISNNIMKGVAQNNGIAPLVLVGGLYNSIVSNKIYRENNDVFAYIAFACFDTNATASLSWDGTGSNGSIKDNFFDSPFCNPTTTNTENDFFSEAVIKVNYINNGAANWGSFNNKNQTGYITIPITDGQLIPFGSKGFVQSGSYGANYFISLAPSLATTAELTTSPFDMASSSAVGSGPTYKSLVMWLSDQSSTAPQYFGWQETVDKYIPIGARLTLVQFTIKPFETLWTTTLNTSPNMFDSQIYMWINTYAPPWVYASPANAYQSGNPLGGASLDVWAGSPGASPDPNITNDASGVSALNINITGGQVNSTTSSLTGVIDLTSVGGTDLSPNYVSGSGHSFGVSLEVRYLRQAGIDTDIYLTPIFFKYRW